MVEFAIDGWCWAYPFCDEKQFTVAISKARRLGFDGIEVPVENPEKLNVPKLRETLQANELPPCNITPILGEIISLDREERVQAKQRAKRNIEIAKQILG